MLAEEQDDTTLEFVYHSTKVKKRRARGTGLRVKEFLF
jgi:hypothetical protein